MKWKTKEGSLVEISEMTTTHLQNTMRLIEQKSYIVYKEFADSGYDGDSYVPDFINVKYKMTKKRLRKESPAYKEMWRELQKRI